MGLNFLCNVYNLYLRQEFLFPHSRPSAPNLVSGDGETTQQLMHLLFWVICS